MDRVMRFKNKGKLNLLAELAIIQPVFHVSILKKCIVNPSLVVPVESIRVKDSLSCDDFLVEILDHQVQRLRNKKVALVKVL